MRLHFLTSLALMLLCSEFSRSEAQLVKPDSHVKTLTTKDSIRFGIWGTELSYPAPTLLVFSATIEESLGDPYYRQCGNTLAELGFLCVSLDLPGHGKEQRPDEPAGLDAWRYRSDRGEDFVTSFTTRVKKVLDYLIQEGYTDPERIAACGTSRGGFMALQTTAIDPRIGATAAFAPVTALMTLREFSGVTNREHADSLSLLAHADRLVGRSLWIMIGDRDARVGTDDAIAFARRVTALSEKQSVRSDVTLIVQPEPRGHTTPEGAPALAAAWISQKLMNTTPAPGEQH